MAAAKYYVTSEPGTYIAGIGFVKPGELYVAPAGHIPSRTALPANAEAVAELKKLQAGLLARAKEVVEDAKDGDDADKKSARLRAKNFEAQAKEIKLEAFKPPVEEATVQSGLTLEQLEGLKGSDPNHAPGEKAQPSQQRKL